MKIGAFINPTKKQTNKDKARQIIADNVGENRTSFGDIVTLPNVTWAIEERIMEYSHRYHFLAVEFDPIVYRKMAKIGLDNNYEFTPFRGTLLAQLKKIKKNGCSHIIADYCGQFHSFTEDLRLALDKKLFEKNGSMFLTYCTRLTGNFKQNADWKRYGKKKVKGVNVTEQVINGIVSEYKDFTVNTLLKYSDRKKGQTKGAPMILIEVRRNK